MKEIIRRALTGFIYVVLLLGTTYLNSDAFDFLFMIFGLGCLYEFKRIARIKGYYIFLAYLGIWWIYIYLVKSQIAISALLVATLVVIIALLRFLFTKRKIVFSEIQLFIIAVFYLG